MVGDAGDSIRAIMTTMRVGACGSMACLLIAGCTRDSDCAADVLCFRTQPGSYLAEGGEIRHENVRILGKTQTWLLVYQFTGPSPSLNPPFAAPDRNGKGPFGNCVDERQSSTWPFHPITSATYLELPKVELTGPGITGALTIPRSPPNTAGNLTFRTYDISYGGGPVVDPAEITGFNATLTPEMSTPGGNYTLDLGKKGGPGTDGGTRAAYHMPEAYVPPLGIGGANTVTIPAHRDLEFTWTAPPVVTGASGEHIRETYFNYTLFADPSDVANPPLFICFPDQAGHQLIPAAVIDALPAGGLVINADYTHYLDSREAAPGEFRRFDLVGGYSNISVYAKQ